MGEVGLIITIVGGMVTIGCVVIGASETCCGKTGDVIGSWVSES